MHRKFGVDPRAARGRAFRIGASVIGSAATLGLAAWSCSSNNATTPPPASTPIDASLPSDLFPDTGPGLPGDALPGPPDAADTPDAGCAPRPVTGFTPPDYVPAAIAPSCSAGGFATLGDACFGDAATVDTCLGAVDGGTGECARCRVTPESSDAGYGAVVLGPVPQPNLAGCIQRFDTTDAGADCAKAVQVAAKCAEVSCLASCPIADGPSRDAFVACMKAAAAGPCSRYAQPAAACVAAEEADGGAASRCGQGSAGDQAMTYAGYFCGS